ncbi:aminoglycoside 6-adenylyltransferase [Liberiplasma polymorphum]|uniref:aminoglycoside 6-adenylyltransferase n=1 Tax=Liberiplasma polymorphum TaxID=3374570 RepID=UPI0037722A48
MRTEQEMTDLILNVANENPNIRLVMMNGSRVNPNIEKDSLQDFDIVYYVKDIASFSNDREWIDVFGERLIMQTLDDMIFDPVPESKDYVYLMQFNDGNRIDLTIRDILHVHDDLNEDSLSMILLDKDTLIKHPITPNESSYFVEKPSKAIFDSCLNELYWVSLYVVKGIIRDEFVYAVDHLNIVRNCLKGLLDWYIAEQFSFNVSVGKNCKRYKELLPITLYLRFISTYSIKDYDEILSSLYNCLELANEIALKVSFVLRYDYDETVHESIIDYIHKLTEDYL